MWLRISRPAIRVALSLNTSIEAILGAPDAAEWEQKEDN